MSSTETRKTGSPNTGQQPQQHQQLSASATLQQFTNFLPPSTAVSTALDHYRLSQLYQYALAADRLRGGPLQNSTPGSGAGAAAFQHSAINVFRPEMAAAAAAAAAVPLLYNNPYYRLDPRLALYRPPEEPKPQHSYIGLIAMAILGSVEKKLVLSDIYQYILDNYAYFRSRGPGWRNSIRHNLSLNDCFVKAGRSANGKGHYWAIHPANIEDFTKGDFRRRKAQRKVRRHMGLAVDDEDSPSPPPNSPPPLSILRPTPDMLGWQEHHPNFLRHSISQHLGLGNIGLGHLAPQNLPPDISLYGGNVPLGFNKFIAGNANNNSNSSNISDFPISRGSVDHVSRNVSNMSSSSANKSFGRNRKRQFDVASLLAPESIKEILQQQAPSPSSSGNGEHEQVEYENNDHCSVSPLEKTYDNKMLSSSSSSSFQVHSDDGEGEGDEDVNEEDVKGEQQRGSINKNEKQQDSSVPSALSLSASHSPHSPKISVDNEDDDHHHRHHHHLPTTAAAAMNTSHLHERRLMQRRHHHTIRSRRISGVATTTPYNNNKEQSTLLNCNSRRLNETTSRTFSTNNCSPTDLPFPTTNTGQDTTRTSSSSGGGSDRSHHHHHHHHHNQPNTNELFFQQNPSLASLVILSSRYRELTSSLQLQQHQQEQQITSLKRP